MEQNKREENFQKLNNLITVPHLIPPASQKSPPPNATNHLARLLRPPSPPQGALTTCLLPGLEANCLLRAVGAMRVAKIGSFEAGLGVSRDI